MIWRWLLYAYVSFIGAQLWLAWAVLQTICRGRLRHPPVDLGSPVAEPERYSNCFAWALWRFLQQGGQFILTSSPRIPVWRAHWRGEGDTAAPWHFEPRHPQRGVAAIWHSMWHKGRPRRVLFRR